MDVKFGRVAKKIESLTDEKIDEMINQELKKQINAFFSSSSYYGGNSDFSKVAEKVLRDLMRKVLTD